MADNNNDEVESSFEDLGLDDRILKALAKLGWKKPTLVQEKAIRLALVGKDVLARARTGSGKTGAYVIPVVNKILTSKQTCQEQRTKALVLAPTRELCNQACTNIKEITLCCSREVKCVDVSNNVPLDVQKPLLMDNPDIVVGTPSRVLRHIVAGNLAIQESLEVVVVDEADLLFSFGHEKDMKELLSHFPEGYQALLMSATLSEDTKALKSMILNNPVILKLEEPILPSSEQLKQFVIRLSDNEKFLCIYALLKLRILNGKMIIFLNNVDRCYKVKLYLQQFGISSCVLNSELPVASRCNIVKEFNDGRYDIIIAADETFLNKPQAHKRNNKTLNKRVRDTESGVSRGIDFRNVTTIINFDFPTNPHSYIHRVGRTARGNSRGVALNLVNQREADDFTAVEKAVEDVYPNGIPRFKFDMKEASSLAYRAETARCLVTKDSIREARRREIKAEMFNSAKLKAHFEDNPKDLQVLKHDKSLHVIKHLPQLKNVPEYIVPESLHNRVYQHSKRSHNNTWRGGYKSKGGSRHQKRQGDPLMTYALKRKVKKQKTQ